MAYETEKQNAAAAAMEFVEDGMTIGLDTGSTAKYFVELLADEIADGLIVRCIETSVQTRDLARSLGVPLIPFEQVDRIHLTVDGADEAGPGGVLIKGGGAALLREKIIANASDHMVVIADPTKDVQVIGAFPLPVEVTPFGYTITAKKVHDALVAAGVERPRTAGDRRRQLHPRLPLRSDPGPAESGGVPVGRAGRRGAWPVHRHRADHHLRNRNRRPHH
jgi:ribose 5-phosphate isomerase A